MESLTAPLIRVRQIRSLVHWMHWTLHRVCGFESEQHGEELLFIWWNKLVVFWAGHYQHLLCLHELFLSVCLLSDRVST